jgi:hypothetical protein
LFFLNWQTTIKINFALEVGAAMADYIVSPLEWALTQTTQFCAQNSLSISLRSRRSAFLRCATKVDFKQKCVEEHIPCWVISRHSIENYIPINILKDVLHISDVTFMVKHYESVLDKIRTVDRSIDKVPLAVSTMKKIKRNDILADKPFHDELESELLKYLRTI